MAWAIVYYWVRAVESLSTVIFGSSHAFSFIMLPKGTGSTINTLPMNNFVELIWEFIKVVACYLLPFIVIIYLVSQCH